MSDIRAIASIEAFECVDGTVFKTFREAEAHAAELAFEKDLSDIATLVVDSVSISYVDRDDVICILKEIGKYYDITRKERNER